MEVEVVAPLPPPDSNFDSTCSSPYITAPSSPQRIGAFFYSAPASPTRISSLYTDSDHLSDPSSKLLRNRDFAINDDQEEDFQFDFSGQLTDRISLSAADELFDCGKIRPFIGGVERRSSRRKEIDSVSSSEVRKTGESDEPNEEEELKRGRSTKIPLSSSGYIHKGSRSLSPLRVADMLLEQEENNPSTNFEKSVSFETKNPKSYAASILSAISFSSKGYKKWKLKDLLLFRSASEGSNNKFAALSRKESETVENLKNSSFRSIQSSDSGSVSGSSRRRGGAVSAHEVHYTMNRAVSEELKRKTLLPYKQGLFGCLGFNRTGVHVHEISRGIGSLTRG